MPPFAKGVADAQAPACTKRFGRGRLYDGAEEERTLTQNREGHFNSIGIGREFADEQQEDRDIGDRLICPGENRFQF